MKQRIFILVLFTLFLWQNTLSLEECEQMPQSSTNYVGEFDNSSYEYIGEFTITHYTASIEECGNNKGITATGTKVKNNRTIAVDPNVIPYGTEVVIGDTVYVAEDTGGAIKENRIDIYVSDKTEAINRGVIVRDVWKRSD